MSEEDIRFVVQTCFDSRKIEPSRQAAMLRDVLLSHFDPHLMITQRIREEKEERGPWCAVSHRAGRWSVTRNVGTMNRVEVLLNKGRRRRVWAGREGAQRVANELNAAMEAWAKAGVGK